MQESCFKGFRYCESFKIKISSGIFIFLKPIWFCFPFFCFVLISISGLSQSTFPVNGVHDENHNYYAFTNAVIYLDYKTKIDSAVLLIRDGIIEKTGRNISIPPNAVIYDLLGKFIYPSFIDIYSDYGMPEIKKAVPPESVENFKPRIDRNTKGALNWNDAVKPEKNASSVFAVNKKEAEELRNLGFGTVMTHQKDGIVRGTGTLVTLSDEKENDVMLKDFAAAVFSFDKGSSGMDYPSSQMGAIALLRQTYYDATWYHKNNFPTNTPTKNFSENREYNLSLENFNRNQNIPQIFEANDYQTELRGDRVGDEFGVQYILKGSGDEFKRTAEIKKTAAGLIIPLNFPKPFDVEDPYDALNVSLEELRNWELAPFNPAILEKEKINFSITANFQGGKKNFWENLRKAIKSGLTDSTALKSLTFIPAKMLGMENRIGSLKEGMLANFVITSGNIFDKKNILFENWIRGKRYVIFNYNQPDIRGVYELKVDTSFFELKLEGQYKNPEGTLKRKEDTGKTKISTTVNENLISLVFEKKEKNFSGFFRLSGKINEPMHFFEGKGQTPDGKWVFWKATRIENFIEKPDSVKQEPLPFPKIYFPEMAYGFSQLPAAEPTLIKNATLWTNEPEGILINTDVYLESGKIRKIGKNLEGEIKKNPSAQKPDELIIIDGTGKHLTPGIIDEHSHIAISRGVNESGQAVSAEVRIGDVINPDDINIYRQLAGGVTAAQLLHGSANPIGGQSALIKLKWGFSSEEMKIKGADGFIKFALGENVKQSNWGDFQTVRFPQTRMGVEQVFFDAFTRTKEYMNSNPKLPNNDLSGYPRRDLELDALSEILLKKRFITCHSYVQSEINMLMHVGDSMGFKVNTFTHILEGYKVADKLKKHGAGASSFSDWWAYKFEVKDAIPYNGALMHRKGITVAYNSDDAEMGRRLNQEAAKAVKYGSVSEEDALKFVTLNPARLLHLDKFTGSLKIGKDADLVLWSGNPLSVYSKAEKTFVDGLLLYDAEKDLFLRKYIQEERNRIISKMIKAKIEGEETQKPEKKVQKLFDCETLGD